MTKESLEEIVKNLIPNKYETLTFEKDLDKIKDCLDKIETNKELQPKEEITEGELRATIKTINEKLHKIKTLKDTDRSLFFSAIIIVLHESYFLHKLKNGIEIYEEGIAKLTKEERKTKGKDLNKQAVYDLSKSIIEEIGRLIKSKINTESKQQKWQNQFAFIEDLEIDLYDFKSMVDLINDKIYKSFKVGQKQDVLGKAYKIFLSKAGKVDNKNIILTPDHIKHLMVRLATLNKDDVVLDTCMGTGGFLMEAMEEMEKLAGNDKDKKEHIHNQQLVGSEIDPKLFVLACSNMFLHGDGRSQLYDRDTIKDDPNFNNGEGFFKHIKSLQPTKVIINPPYEDNNCFDFTKQALDFLETNGRLIVIIKENTFQKINEDIRKLLENNTLDFYIKMPADLFSEQNRSVATAIFGWVKGVPHPQNKYVKFYNLSDDGFKNIPHNGRIDIDNTWVEKENKIIDYVLNGGDEINKNVAYTEKIFNEYGELLPIYHHFREEAEPLCEEDFEEAIFDYFVYENGLDEKKLKTLIIRILKDL